MSYNDILFLHRRKTPLVLSLYREILQTIQVKVLVFHQFGSKHSSCVWERRNLPLYYNNNQKQSNLLYNRWTCDAIVDELSHKQIVINLKLSENLLNTYKSKYKYCSVTTLTRGWHGHKGRSEEKTGSSNVHTLTHHYYGVRQRDFSAQFMHSTSIWLLLKEMECERLWYKYEWVKWRDGEWERKKEKISK